MILNCSSHSTQHCSHRRALSSQARRFASQSSVIQRRLCARRALGIGCKRVLVNDSHGITCRDLLRSALAMRLTEPV